MDLPPFEILSHKDFPSITESEEAEKSRNLVKSDKAVLKMPSFIPSWPKKDTLCKTVSTIIKSPQKLIPARHRSFTKSSPSTLAVPHRSCLKPTCRSRNVSECSDDFIVFEYDDESDDDDDDDDSSDEDEDESSDDDSEMSEDIPFEDIDEVDEAVTDKKEVKAECDPPLDSGIVTDADAETVPKKKKVRKFIILILELFEKCFI